MKSTYKNNGFSLVELIVVIAIMAVLVGVLAPQFIKLVEKSRMATDVQNIETLLKLLLQMLTGMESPFHHPVRLFLPLVLDIPLILLSQATTCIGKKL